MKIDKPNLILIRGIPGSGKSTLAKTRYLHAVLVEADIFFMQNGVYCFDASRLGEAHAWCQRTVKKALDSGRNVVVANTFIRIWEMQPYLDMPYPVTVVEAKGNYQNVHGVPDSVVHRMRDRFEPYTPE